MKNLFRSGFGLILLLSVFVSKQASAQNGKVQGRVYDEVTNESLPFVNVLVVGSTTGTTTDLDGNFLFTGLEPGIIQLQVSFVGYKPRVSEEIVVSNAKTPYVEIALSTSDQEIEEVVVTASPFRRTEESPVSLRTIGVSEIENSAGANRDISRVIQSLPGVGGSVSFRNDIIIRGGGPSENRFYLDGVEIPNLNHFATEGASGGPVGILNADFISGVNFYSGAFPANRGNALSGVFEFTQKDGNKEKLRVGAVVGASDLALTLDGPLGERTTFIFSARQSYLQFLFSAIGLPFLPKFNDFQFKSRTRINDKNELTLVGLGALDRFELNLDIEEPTPDQEYILGYLPIQNQWNYMNGAVWKHFSGNSYQTFVLSRNMLNNRSLKYQDNDDSDEANKTLDYVSQEIENKFRFETNHRFSGFKFVGGVGLEYAKYNNNTFQRLFVQDQLLTIDYESELSLWKYNAFAQLSKSVLSERLALSAGVRFDGTSYSESMANPLEQFSPRLSASYALTERISINANTGRYYQLPAYTTLGYRDSDGVLANKANNLKFISVDHVIGGLEFLPYDYMQFTLEGFYKQYGNYPFSLRDSIALANKGSDFGVIGDEPVASISEGRAYGIEFLNRIKLPKYNLIFAYTWVRSEFEDKNGEMIPSAWDSQHLLTITTTWTPKPEWKFGARWRFVGGLPYTPYDLETSSLVAAWDAQRRPYLDYDRLNQERFTSFHQLDVRVDRFFYFSKWTLGIYFDIQNFYNFKQASQDFVVVNRDEQGQPILLDNGTRYDLLSLPNESGTLLPTLGLQIRV